MASTGEPMALLERALDQAQAAIDGATGEQADRPTPCRSWTVRDLVEHLVRDTEQFTLAAQGGRPSWSGPAAAVTGDWSVAFREGADVLRAAWKEAGDLTETVQLQIGAVPKEFIVRQQIAEFAVHTWDLVTATSQELDLDPDVAQSALDWARTALRPEFRGDEESGKSFGPEVAAPPDASAHDRLAAFFGRQVGYGFRPTAA
jgi:uncharacterized protein (TIGR03086 family)